MVTELTPEERQRIYEEEKARLEAQEQLKKEQIQKTNKGCYGCLGVFVAVFAIILLISLVNGSGDKETASDVVGLHASYGRSATQVKVTNMDDFAWTEVELRLNPGVASAYEYHLSELKPGESATIGLLNFTKSNGDRFNPFQSSVKELHIIAQTKQGEGATGFRWTN